MHLSISLWASPVHTWGAPVWAELSSAVDFIGLFPVGCQWSGVLHRGRGGRTQEMVEGCLPVSKLRSLLHGLRQGPRSGLSNTPLPLLPSLAPGLPISQSGSWRNPAKAPLSALCCPSHLVHTRHLCHPPDRSPVKGRWTFTHTSPGPCLWNETGLAESQLLKQQH